MKINKFLTAALAATTLLASCSKEAGNTNSTDGKDKVVVLKVVQATGETRAEANETGAAAITLSTGYVFFTDVAGGITRQVSIVASGATGNDEVNVTDITNESTGATVVNVPDNSTKCYVVSRVPVGTVTGSLVGSNISALTSKTIALADMTDATNNTVVNVPLFGEGTVAPHATLENMLTTTVPVGALGARLQVKSFEGITDITSYQIDGIFVNNFFATMPISKTLAASAVVDYASDQNKYITGGSGGYASYASLMDYDAEGLGANGTGGALERVPENTNNYAAPVWAYNIFPTEGVDSEDQADVFPMIVVRLSKVKWMNGSTEETLSGPQFLTVKGMKQGATSLTKIDARHVYTYSNIQFSREHLTTVPVVTSIDAQVTVSLLPWVPVAVTPEL